MQPKTDNLAELQRRKAALKARMEQERTALKVTFQEFRQEIEPANLLKNAVKSTFGFGGKTPDEADSGLLGRLPGPLRLVADLFIRDPRAAFVIKFVAPTALKFLPQILPDKEQLKQLKPWQQLRKGVSSLRNRLRKNKDKPEDPIESTE